MTELNQIDLRLAKKWLGGIATQEESEAVKRIIAALPDPAPLTMADVEWNQSTHYLMEAEHPQYGRVVMTWGYGRVIRGQLLDENIEDGFPSQTLTPTGRKYKLVPEGETLPALPKGMRLADHKEHGRVVTSPWVDGDEDYKIFLLDDSCRGGAGYDFASESELTFVDLEPARELSTKQDFEDAPIGTVVKRDLSDGEKSLAVKLANLGWKMVMYPFKYRDSADMVKFEPWTVLEWGTK